MSHPVRDAQRVGQSIWFDHIRRAMFASGELGALIDQQGVTGVTSNPSIFEKAIAGSTDYDRAIRQLLARGVADAQAIYEHLAIEDIRSAADLLRRVYEQTEGRDGYVSLEVSPYLAHNAEETVAEGQRLFKAVGRGNVMIKVPATPEGLVAVERLVAAGISVNVTLIFAVPTYDAVAEAFVSGLEQFVESGGRPQQVASVASFFVSRIDASVDARLGAALTGCVDPERRAALERLRGRTAIANAKVAYGRYLALVATDRWKALAARGARTQRLLWASTGTKDPRLPRTRYVEELIGADTVNTVPAETLQAFLSDGRVRASLIEHLDAARADLDALESLGISLRGVTDALLREGLSAFSASFDRLLGAIEHKRQGVLGASVAGQRIAAGDAATEVQETLERWRSAGNVGRLWQRDATLWTGHDESAWLGWLHAPCNRGTCLHDLRALEADGRTFRHIVLLGMGGSSLCPWVLGSTFGPQRGHPTLLVLDSVDPAQIRAVERAIDLPQTLFLVASKSGGTAEPNALLAHFQARLSEAGLEAVNRRFLAITDPGTPLEALANRDGFRYVLPGLPDVGGRFSALTNFGLVPAALMGLDVGELLERAEIMVHACAPAVPAEENPGVALGVLLGTLARRGRDKLTLVTAPPVETLGAWLEQLVAESTGKNGRGIVPVDGEPLGPPEVYGTDRVFVQIRTRAGSDSSGASDQHDAALAALERAGHPVVRIALDSALDIGQEFFRWEIATAVAGSILEVNAFNQPDVEAAKVATRTLMTAYERGGAPAPDAPLLAGDGLRFHTDAANAAALAPASSAEALVAAHLARLEPGDYFAVNAFLAMTDEHDRELQGLRRAVRDGRRVATTLGYGPRFLHSTGQLHKGGPNRGVFLVLLSDDSADLPVPQTRYTFGAMKRAQALGDCQVLAERGRRLLRVEIGPDTLAGLRRLRALVEAAVGATRA